MMYMEDTFKEAELGDYKRRRDNDPTITVSWIASAMTGQQVPLNGFSCPFCKTTVADHIRGQLVGIVNAPLALQEFSFGLTMRCKYCKQKWRFVYTEHQML